MGVVGVWGLGSGGAALPPPPNPPIPNPQSPIPNPHFFYKKNYFISG